MSDPMISPDPRHPESWLEPGKLNVQLVYALYLLSFLIGISGLIGLVFAYLNRGKAGGWIDTHYTYAIRTFWIGLLYGLVSAILSLAVIGVLLAIGTVVWVVVRCIIGLQKATAGEPIAKPETWWV
ncbi:MAG: hypothetical protein KJ670_05320 [Alphaproteobacteria bacterium]|nr:hypothetical protein [Rhizobiaceae bacterium]MBU3961014.1 hypothetical protein [Alphaproteobacteria bacterium]MBU4051096.1 hypothetical protein [Alphaproteobacteria bacterium]MBU4088125.1 hypothetical protein [Alphaproteobacteria bacterium]MBU4155817.1 hypothetical protein [Alphaproteobacteria bacterium]